MAKAPAMQFYVKDWMSDTASLSLEAKGAWIQICCVLHLAERRGQATKSFEAWARICGCPKEVIQRVLTELSDDGASRVTFRDNGVTVVCRRMDRERKDKENHALRQSRYRAKRVGDEKVTSPSAFAVSASSKKTQEKQQKKKNPQPPSSLQTPTFLKAWEEWEQHRKEIGKRLTPLAVTKQLKQLAVEGSAVAVQMIEQSIANGWQGLFPLKDKTATPRRSRGDDYYANGF